MLGKRYEIARFYSDFYRDNYRKILRGIFIALAIVFVLIAVIIYLIIFKPQPHYYATTTGGQIISMYPAVIK